MEHEPENATSHRVASLTKKLKNKKYRDSYLASHTKMFLANQISSLQGEMSQEEFGKLLDKPQPIISRLQNPEYGKYTLQTLLEIASKLDVALIARFVDYPTFLKLTNDFSDEALRPASFNPDQLELLPLEHDYNLARSSWAGEMASTILAGHGAAMVQPTNISQGLQSFTQRNYACIGGITHE